MPKAVKFSVTYFDLGAPKYEADKTYPETEETLRCVARGIAESVNVKAAEIEADPDAVKVEPAVIVKVEAKAD